MTSKYLNQSPIQSKPLKRKAYGHIAHLPGSRLGPGDHHCSEGEAKILTEKARDQHDHITVTEKLDGSNVAICRIDNEIIPINRAGYRANTASNNCHRSFAKWVYENPEPFDTLLEEGEWLSGEWLALAHGTLYDLKDRPPFVAFDLWTNNDRNLHKDLSSRCRQAGITTAPILWEGGPCSIGSALDLLGEHGHYGAIDPAEGCVWRCERKGECKHLAKYVRPGKIDGKYLPPVSGEKELWLYL